MNKTQTLLLLIGIALLVGTGSMLLIVVSMTETIAVPVDYAVADAVLFNLDNDTLNFGGAPPGSKIKRDLRIKADYNANYKLYVGEELQGILIQDGNWTGTLEAGKLEIIPVTIQIPEKTKGDHKGTLYLRIVRRI